MGKTYISTKDIIIIEIIECNIDYNMCDMQMIFLKYRKSIMNFVIGWNILQGGHFRQENVLSF